MYRTGISHFFGVSKYFFWSWSFPGYFFSQDGNWIRILFLKKISQACLLSACLFRFFSNLKNIGQNWHLKASCGKIPWIVARCFFKSIRLKAFSQTSQVTFVCSILTWLRNLAEVGNFRWQVSHWNFALFSCFIITSSRSRSFPGYFFSQCGHWIRILFLTFNFFGPVEWLYFTWLFKAYF